MTARVTVVLLNYLMWQDTVACVQSLLLQNHPDLQIVVVDNASPNDSVPQLQAALPPSVTLLLSPANGGFAAGCNLGIRHALAHGAEYVWLLNNDTVAPPDTLTLLLAAAATHPPGLTGTVLYLMSAPATVQAWGGGNVSPLTGFNSHQLTPFQPGPNSFLTFASVLIATEVFTSIGLLDEGFFMYYEDADFCFRATAAGFRLAVASETAVLHKEGGSGQPRQTLSKIAIVTSSGLRFLARHGRPRLLSQAIYLGLRLGKRLARADWRAATAVLRGWSAYRRTSSAISPSSSLR